jgi:methionyl-tRNA formyltransferase
VALRALQTAQYTIPVVLTQPDRPHGRGQRPAPSPVKVAAQAGGLRVLQPPTLRDGEVQRTLEAIAIDVLVVAAYGLILPPAVLAWPRFGCINVHASRLPRWRGAAPIARAIEAGDANTGVSLMQMDEGLDTGAVIEVDEVAIAPRETAGSLHDKLALAGAAALLRVLRRMDADGALPATPQPAQGATYAAKITRAEAALDWRKAAAVLDRQVRAFDPTPGAFAVFGGEVLKIRAAQPLSGAPQGAAAPGTVLATGPAGVDVACGEGVLRLLEVRPAGRGSMPGHAYALGHAVAVGSRFDLPAAQPPMAANPPPDPR